MLADAALALSAVETVEQAHAVLRDAAPGAGDAEWQLRQLATFAVQRLEALEGERAARRDAERAARTYSLLSEAGTVFAGSLDGDALVAALLGLVVPRLADWAALHVAEEGGVELSALHRADPGADDDHEPDGRLAGEVLTGGTHQLVGGVLVVPLTARGRTFAALSMGRATPYAEADVAYALDLARGAALALDNAGRYAQERRMAETLQRSLLPRGMPTSALLTSASRYLAGAQGTQVGGDWYDLIELPDGALVLVVGDVMGRGLGAAAVMGQLRATVRAYALDGHGPAAIMQRLERVVDSLDELNLTTCVIGRLEPRTRSLRLCSAGHLPPLVVDPDGSAWFLKLDPGLPLGVGGATYVEQRVVLDPASLLLLYTDGLVEDREHPIEHGLERLRAAAEQGLARSPEELCDRVLAALGRAGGAHDDDTALLALLLDEVAEEQPLVLDLPALPESAAPARRALSGLLALGSIEEDVRDTAALLVTELVTNAARHAGGELRVRAGVRTDTLLVEVSDVSPDLPELAGLPDWDAESGRGLVLVDALADRWGSDPLPTGKRVWFELSVGETVR